MKARQQGEKKARKQYGAAFKGQALKRAEKDGVAMAARDLGLAQSQHAELARLQREVARLEGENAFRKKAPAYFAKQPR